MQLQTDVFPTPLAPITPMRAVLSPKYRACMPFAGQCVPKIPPEIKLAISTRLTVGLRKNSMSTLQARAALLRRIMAADAVRDPTLARRRITAAGREDRTDKRKRARAEIIVDREKD